MDDWIDIKEKGMPRSIACKVKDENGNIKYGAFIVTPGASGIALVQKETDCYKWNGKTWLLKITHWQYAEIPGKQS
ncbi:hypothetical protein KAR91_67440 [Candidatus Pacearchaeota archaeon]|nr:hypothetical protein [Candidatus Pacearchaeota archaeon]